MTQQEIRERNKQIAMLVTIEPEVLEGDLLKAGTIESMHYHDDWNWLMEAVGFIEKYKNYKYSVYTLKGCCQIFKFYHTPKEKLICTTTYNTRIDKKEAVFTAVSDFAKLYNEKKI
jgi:hypothetical protein